MDIYSFYMGKSFDAYEDLGCHLTKDGAVFRVFAPNALKVALVGDFNNWKEYEMKRVFDGKFWEAEIKDVKPGAFYKYKIYSYDGKTMEHCDPYGFGMELRPKHASVVRDMKKYKFSDSEWMKKRTDCLDGPLNIYEMHAGSWRKPSDVQEDWFTYEELARLLIPYLKEMCYNYIELMPLAEYPSDESWGYQSTGFYSPTSRYGDCDGLKYFVDMCHQNKIGVILDFVPVHFAVDGYGLADFDGTAIYEYPYADVGYSEWGSKNFNHSRGEVRSFLQSSANYWLKEYHFDGLRMDAISNIIYWQGNAARGVNQNAVNFLRDLNAGLKKRNNGIILAAEDSTTYPGITKKPEEGGLGFDYKWNMGWMHDILEYFQSAPEYRRRDYHKLTFSLMYFYSERFILPFSHDEVVHGKATILQKMYGFYDTKFPQARALYMYMCMHPGKKLNFMGAEWGQLREWDEKREQDWAVLKYPNHDAFRRYMRDLNTVYLKYSELWKKDYDSFGFWWADCHQEEKCIYAIGRTNGENSIIGVFNFSDLEQDYVLNQQFLKDAELILDSDWQEYGGTTEKTKEILKANEYDNISMRLKPYSGRIFRVSYRTVEDEKKETVTKQAEKDVKTQDKTKKK